ncbi:hypothetical protein D9611_001832 [Ephemerocybe angulata]|uniref:Rho1 guanine nucleotide exchange factor 1 n=1 Tax=Ephemerocybe angulata TaxID=980116 RepID=A0A8H5CHC3_9AGAR|nr:hypothetical protein D9611_001832 [Tulosesus angulatus]
MYSDSSNVNTGRSRPAQPPGPNTNTTHAGNHVNGGRRPHYQPSPSTNPFDFPRDDSPPPPPIPPRPYLNATASSPPPLPPPPPPQLYHANTNSSRYAPPTTAELRPFPVDRTESLNTSDLSAPSSSASSRHPSPSGVAPAYSPPAYEYFNNPWEHPGRGGGPAGGLGIPETTRPRAKSSVEHRPSQSRAHTVSTFVAPTMAFPMPEMPSMGGGAAGSGASLGRATSATAHLPSPATRPPPTNHATNVHGLYPQSVVGYTPKLNGEAVNRGPAGAPSRPSPATSTPSLLPNDNIGRRPPLGGHASNATPSPAPTPPTYEHRPSPSAPGGSNRTSSPAHTTPMDSFGRRLSSGESTPPAEGTTGRRPSSGKGAGRGEFRFSPNLMRLQHAPSVASFQSTASSYYRHADDYGDGFASPTDLQLDDEFSNDFAKELSNLSLDMEENILRFQKGELPEPDQEWHKLVPEEALQALEDSEIKRQGIIFELLKAERDYVADLETIEEVFVKRLKEANPPVIPAANMQNFLNNVFGNLREILVHHQKMLEALFERQRESHPLIPSLADIILETILKPEFRDAYETYIKNYPMAESLHQRELQGNPRYAAFLQSVSREPRVKKRDFKIFLSRPLTRLVRLNLLVGEMHKRTNKDHGHPDVETLPIILGIVSDCIKATQPGIEAAEQKVKFWDLIENITFQKGEIIHMDLYDKERHLVHAGPVWRKLRSETGFSSDKWQDVTAHLLDNYFILSRPMRIPTSGAVKQVVISRPLPLSFIRLASFEAAPEIRREKIEDGGLLDTFRSRDVPLYPFTIYHSSPDLMKAYTMYVATDGMRQKWKAAFVDALGVHKVRQESNQWFAQDTLIDGFFRIPREPVSSPTQKATGRVTSAVPFATQNGQRFIAIGCANGIYVAPYNRPKELMRVFTYSNPSYIAALQSIGDKNFNKFIVQAEGRVFAFSLELVARYATGNAKSGVLEASREKVTSSDQNVLFVRHVILNDRVLLIYASKKRMSSSVNLHAIEAIAHSLQRNGPNAPASFRPYGSPGYIPKEASDLVGLHKTISVCVKGGLVSADPGNFPATIVGPFPLFGENSQTPAANLLKSKLEGAKSLGIIKTGQDEFIVIYDEIGCYVNGKGQVMRGFAFIKWETKATSYAQRNGLALLISPRFIEIRNVANGALVQVIEGGDIRLLYSEPEVTPHDNILVAMRGKFNDSQGLSEKIVELITTVELPASGAGPPPASVWSEWDM